MIKYLKLMTYAAVAVAFASPTYADIVNLYEMNNSEFFGSEGFGHGQDGYTYKCNKSNHEYDYIPAGMICDDKKYGNVTCHINCRCKNDYKYSEDNCNNGLVLGGSSCTNPGTTKKLYTACDCGPDAITESDYNYLSRYFTTNSFEIRSINNGEKTCRFFSSPKCKDSYKQINGQPTDDPKSELSTGRFTASLTSAVQPIKYSFAASSVNPKSTSGTVYCLYSTTIPEKFNGALSFNESELNATCSNRFHDKAKLNNKDFYYYTDQCNTSDDLCNTDGVQSPLTSSFTYYDPRFNYTKPINCSYILGDDWCKIKGYEDIASVSCKDGVLKECPYSSAYAMCIKSDTPEDKCTPLGYEHSCTKPQDCTGEDKYKKWGICPHDRAKCGCVEEMTPIEKCQEDGFDTSQSPFCENENAQIQTVCEHAPYYGCRDRLEADLAEYTNDKCKGYNKNVNSGPYCPDFQTLKYCPNTPDGDGLVYYKEVEGGAVIKTAIYYKCTNSTNEGHNYGGDQPAVGDDVMSCNQQGFIHTCAPEEYNEGPSCSEGGTIWYQQPCQLADCETRGYKFKCEPGKTFNDGVFCQNPGSSVKWYESRCHARCDVEGTYLSAYTCCNRGGIKDWTYASDGTSKCYTCCNSSRASVPPPSNNDPCQTDQAYLYNCCMEPPYHCFSAPDPSGGGAGGGAGGGDWTDEEWELWWKNNYGPNNNNKCFSSYCNTGGVAY